MWCGGGGGGGRNRPEVNKEKSSTAAFKSAEEGWNKAIEASSKRVETSKRIHLDVLCAAAGDALDRTFCVTGNLLQIIELGLLLHTYCA